MSLPGIDVASFQGPPGSWRSLAPSISWAAVKFTELSPDGSRYTDPDAAADWEFLRQQGKGRIAYLFARPGSSPAETVQLFASVVAEAGLERGDGICLDHETTDGRNPAQVTVWAKSVLRQLQGQLGRVPLVYTFRDFAAAGNCSGLQGYPLWISDPSSPAGRPAVPAPWKAWAIHQFAITGAVDRDVASFATLDAMARGLGVPGVTPPPSPAPAPQPKEREMILVEVDKATVPAGTAWPGVFLLASDGTLHHVTAGAGDVNNVASYQKAGIPGPAAITYGEFLARS